MKTGIRTGLDNKKTLRSHAGKVPATEEFRASEQAAGRNAYQKGSVKIEPDYQTGKQDAGNLQNRKFFLKK